MGPRRREPQIKRPFQASLRFELQIGIPLQDKLRKRVGQVAQAPKRKHPTSGISSETLREASADCVAGVRREGERRLLAIADGHCVGEGQAARVRSVDQDDIEHLVAVLVEEEWNEDTENKASWDGLPHEWETHPQPID